MKKSLLILAGIGNTFFCPSSPRFLNRAPEIKKSIETLMANNPEGFHTVVRINDVKDSLNAVDSIFNKIPATRLVDIKMSTTQKFLSDYNTMIINDVDGGQVHLGASQFDHVFNPEEYDIYIAGIDINGVFIDLVDASQDLGYFTTVYCDIIKPYSKDTITHIKRSDVKFRSSGSK